MHRAVLVSYDTREYDFAGSIASTVFHVDSLPLLHLAAQRRKRRPLNATDSLGYRRVLTLLPDDAPFYSLYTRFVWEVVAPLFHGHISYTLHPTFRVQFPRTGTISRWHRDADVTGRVEQINVWAPFVDCAGTNTIWVESHYDRQDYRPYDVRYGELLLFDGGFLAHGSVNNETETTRVSLDLRLHPLRPTRLGSWILGARPADLRPPAAACGTMQMM
ncbi:MAG TPA: streptomycin biosynthesis enzyme StrG, partial [Thermoanaerobaculia bacterium]|jgi:hypothetical protein|nr:streptomycin biosynthesis enzyme StrG [Thermoanaerobaculia bacterium]